MPVHTSPDSYSCRNCRFDVIVANVEIVIRAPIANQLGSLADNEGTGLIEQGRVDPAGLHFVPMSPAYAAVDVAKASDVSAFIARFMLMEILRLV